jgi:xanthine dehydrogenase accessory factor
MFDILEVVDSWLRQGKNIALATVVETWGSSPRQAGAKMAVTDELSMIGSVSGGCVETAVVQEGSDGLSDHKPRLLHFGVSDDTAWNVGLACGGRMSVYVEPLDKDWWRAAADATRQNRATASIVVLEGETAGQKMLIDAAGTILYGTDRLTPGQKDALVTAGRAAIERRKPERVTVADLNVLIDVHRPLPRLIIVGGAHVAMALHSFARQLGFRVALIDPRRVFATPERFPDIDCILHTYPDKALLDLGLDSETYVAVLTHDPKIDDPALKVALPSPAPYVGVLSSKRSHQKRVERLTAAGVDPRDLERVRTPIGLEIGAKTPEEIALSIMAEIVAARNGALV